MPLSGRIAGKASQRPTIRASRIESKAASMRISFRPITSRSPTLPRYKRTCLENVEDVEEYRPGGFHPIKLGDLYHNDRYRILHKLGFGGFSTVWLARDEQRNRLVSLKVLTAEASRQPTELRMAQQLEKRLQGTKLRRNLLSCLDSFTVDGSNGTHLCYVSQIGGPTLSSMSDSPGEIAGTRRIAAPLARKLAQQLASLISEIHDIDIVHGGMLDATKCEVPR